MIRIRNIKPLIFIVIALFIAGCDELTETLLSQKQISIIAPVDSLITHNTTNTFAWENVDGAAKYQLQIVSPKFDSVLNFIVDSTFLNTQFTYTLFPGKYQWRIRALNANTQTKYFIRTFTIL